MYPQLCNKEPIAGNRLSDAKDLALSSMKEIAALVDFLDQKRILLAKEVMYIRYTRQ